MITIDKLAKKDIYIFEVNGDIDRTDADKIAQLLQHRENDEKIKLLGVVREIPGFEDFKAFSEALKVKMESLFCISKYAVLSDMDLIENIVPIGNFITPSIPMKVFEMEEREMAIEWLESDDENAVDEDDYLTEMDIDHIHGTNIYTMTIDGEMNKAGMAALREVLKEKTKTEKINLLAIVIGFDGFDDFGAFVEGLKVNFSAIGNIGKYALISDKNWIKTLAPVGNFLSPGIAMKAFDIEDMRKAIAWLER